MTMHARDIGAVAPVALGEVFGAVRPRPNAAKAAAMNINGPSLVVVAPDKVDAIAGGCGKAGLEGGAKPLWTLGLVLLVVL